MASHYPCLSLNTLICEVGETRYPCLWAAVKVKQDGAEQRAQLDVHRRWELSPLPPAVPSWFLSPPGRGLEDSGKEMVPVCWLSRPGH